MLLVVAFYSFNDSPLLEHTILPLSLCCLLRETMDSFSVGLLSMVLQFSEVLLLQILVLLTDTHVKGF